MVHSILMKLTLEGFLMTNTLIFETVSSSGSFSVCTQARMPYTHFSMVNYLKVLEDFM